MSLSRYEKETVINYNSEEKVAYISSSQDWMKRRIKHLAEKYPNDVKITSEDEYTVMAEVPKKYIRFGPPRVLSDEQKQAAAERLKNYRKLKNKTNE